MKKLENLEFKSAVGKSTLCRIDWKSWDVELPPIRVPIYIIVKLESGYFAVTGIYYEQIIPASKDGHFPETHWKVVKFDDPQFPDTFIPPHKDNNYKRLIAWGKLKAIISLGEECEVCKRLDCSC